MNRPTRLTTSRRIESLFDRIFFCPECATWRLPRRPSARPPRSAPQRQYASTLASSTAIHATKPIPPRFKELYEALADIKKKASAQVSLSRLQLALQGLESEKPPTRVAVLGLNVQDTARRVARLLLADALNQEERWEKQLLREDDYPQGLLIRYGAPPNASLPQSRTSIPTLYIPASILERNGVEILVSSVSAGAEGESITSKTGTSDALLAPTVGTPTSANGRYTFISQPVHKTLLVGNGLDELVLIAELLASINFSSSGDRKLVDIAVNLSGSRVEQDSRATIVDTSKAEQGLAAIRKSLSQATIYEHNWLESGMPSLSKWLTLACSSSEANTRSTLPPPVANLISSLLSATSANLRSEALVAAQFASSRSMSPASRTSLDTAITNFSQQAHQELQSGLASAWSSRNWRKLAWYKLFWRVDDVSLIITDLVTNGWLPNTERSVYELSGRLAQAGISPIDAELEQLEAEVEPAYISAMEPRQTFPPEVPYRLERSTEATVQPVLISRDGSHVSLRLDPPPQPVPLAFAISTTRTSQMSLFIDSLTTTAQQLVFRTLSITGLTAGLSGLAYFSVAAGSIYEAGTIVALGTAYALRRMQTDWQYACRGLEDGLLENGKLVVKRVEEKMRTLVREGGIVKEDIVEVESRSAAEKAVEKAKRELKKLT